MSCLESVAFHVRKNFMAPYYRWSSTVSKLVQLRGDSLLFSTKFEKIMLNIIILPFCWTFVPFFHYTEHMSFSRITCAMLLKDEFQ